MQICLQINNMVWSVHACWFCSDDSETTTSNISCPPRWIRTDEMSVIKGSYYGKLTEQECQEACAANPSCVAIDLKDPRDSKFDRCWIHEKPGLPYNRNNEVTHFDIVRQCNTKLSTYPYHFYIIVQEY